MDYRQAGDDIGTADSVKRRIGVLARGTFNPAVLSAIGSFGALYLPDLSRYREPVLVARERRVVAARQSPTHRPDREGPAADAAHRRQAAR